MKSGRWPRVGKQLLGRNIVLCYRWSTLGDACLLRIKWAALAQSKLAKQTIGAYKAVECARRMSRSDLGVTTRPS